MMLVRGGEWECVDCRHWMVSMHCGQAYQRKKAQYTIFYVQPFLAINKIH